MSLVGLAVWCGVADDGRLAQGVETCAFSPQACFFCLLSGASFASALGTKGCYASILCVHFGSLV